MSDALERLREVMRGVEGALVALSGGVDSALVAAVAHDVLGARAVALTADSPTFPAEELAVARRTCLALGMRHLVVEARELDREGYAANAGDRCYFCKTELFELARETAGRLGLPVVLDGTILDDLGAHRPGLKAAAENGVRHPLVEAGLDKAAVREAARRLGLEVWDKPAFACLGSRFPVGTRVTGERVRMVAQVETLLRTLGFRQFRVRWHELEGLPLARIELPAEELGALVREGVRESVAGACREAGFRFVTVDLEGFRSGSLSHRLTG